jgi:FtsP/CotA-like multicopper oxidase with cupredoxin domain
VEPKAYRFRILNAAHDRFWNLQLYKADTTAVAWAGRTEVKMVPAVACNCNNIQFPAYWPLDGREGGVPDPTNVGPTWLQIGTESGFLPVPVEVPIRPVSWNGDPTTFNAGNVDGGSLLLGPAERADVIVDFSKFPGETLILYNDAPAAFPALDPRYDYYTGNPDLTDTGGAPSTQPGYGPNTRTLMQIRVKSATPAPTYSFDALRQAFLPSNAAIGGVFKKGQEDIIVGQKFYNEAYNMAFPKTWPNWGISRIQDNSLSFMNTAGQIKTLAMQPKAIHDEMGAAYDEYGRMSAKLGLEVPFTGNINQTFILRNYVDPTTETVKTSAPGPVSDNDGTQIWKITHNGVDTHPVHFHLFDVQLINRVGWDGAIRPPDPNEMGWKDTIRISPLEDTIVAVRPIGPKPPFGIPNSVRPLNPALPLGANVGFTNIDQFGNPIAPVVINAMFDFDWEYVWHCHILSHEEADMMRPINIKVASQLPVAPVLTRQGTNTPVALSWTDGTPATLVSTLGNRLPS